MQIRQAAILDEAQRVLKHRVGFGRKADDEIGAEDDVGAQPPQLRAEIDRVGAGEWRRFMRFRIMSSPDCSERCRCGVSRGSVCESVDQVGVGLDAVDRGEAQPLEAGRGAQDRLDEAAQASRRRQDRRHRR